MIGDIMQPTHLLFVLVVALLVLGPKRLPEVGRQLGNGIRDFRAAINGERPHHEEELDASAQPVVQPVEQPAPSQPAEHQFAHEAVGPGADEHRFAQAASEPADSTHQFAHEDPVHASAGEAGVGRAAGEHEFAHEPARSAEKPVDPLT